MHNVKYGLIPVIFRNILGLPPLTILYMKPIKLDKFQNSRIFGFILSQSGSHITYYLTTLVGSGIAPRNIYIINVPVEKHLNIQIEWNK